MNTDDPTDFMCTKKLIHRNIYCHAHFIRGALVGLIRTNCHKKAIERQRQYQIADSETDTQKARKEGIDKSPFKIE